MDRSPSARGGRNARLPERAAATLAKSTFGVACLAACLTAWATEMFAAEGVRTNKPPPAAATRTAATNDTETGAISGRAADDDANASPREREAAHSARLDAAIAPLPDYKLSKTDATHIRDAIKALYKGKAEEAVKLRGSVSDPLGRKLIDWYRLRQGHGEAAEFRAFLDDNPDWPSRSILEGRMEAVLFAEGGDASVLTAFFKNGRPQSAAGMGVLASVHLAHGETEKARAIASEIWREHDLPISLERGFLARFRKLLTEEDHKWRLDRLLVEDVRWKTGRKQRAAEAKRVIPHLSKAEQKKAKARLAVFLRARGAKSQLKAPGDNSPDWGLVFHKIQTLRRADKLDEAAKLMLGAPLDPEVVVNLDDWWTERQKLGYLALEANKPKLAYELVREAGPLTINPLNEQSFMAGWIALRYLKDAAAAQKHSASYTQTADGPLGRAKAYYWLGRAHEALGQKEKASQAYRDAARESDTFHGLLALEKLHPASEHIKIEPPQVPTPSQIARFGRLEVSKVVALAHEAKLSRGIERIFLRHLATLDDSEGWAVMSAHLAQAIGDTQTGVRIGKAAIARGHNLIYYSYPVHALPEYKPLREPPETAVLFGLARQETEFNTDVVSGAGARGILQVMSGTGRYVCRQYRIKCSTTRLQSDPSYNTMIASAYVADRLDQFSGSYILGISSYNAGPGRTSQWIREFGDPRKPFVDPIDWIERIPIEETRRYVTKVLANIQIYRARLGNEKTALRLHKDLARARAAALVPLPHKAERGTDTAKSGG
jgi:soluble lytic murein transglycosylase